ncbi:MAG: diphthamide biosynthesis enzyme Dph2 [Archaeoglobus sp.]|nr:diphthamide biosynthesis enzyme Dph2 [Archaeoglobus sp.]
MQNSEKLLEKINFQEIFDELERRKAKVIGIQLPDGLKFFTKEIAERFEKLGFETIISASAAYGACDVDLMLAEEVDVLVHFAHLPIRSLKKVIFAPYYYDFSIELISNHLERIEEREISLAGTAHYAWKFSELKKFLEDKGLKVYLGKPRGRVRVPGQVLGCNYSVVRSKARAILFVGDGDFHARGAAIYTRKKVYFWNPLSNEFRTFGKEFVDDFIRKRFLRISKAMEVAEKGVGIIVSSKPGQKRLAIARKLRNQAEKNGIKATIIYFNDINPEALENFPFGVYVNTACPRITYDDPERFGKPILSPQEFEILIGIRDWKDYEIDEFR